MALHTVHVSVGERQHRVVLENPGDPVPDGNGGFTESWTPLAALWGRVVPASEADLRSVVAGTVTALLPYLVVVPFVAGVTTETRISYHGRTFVVQAVRNVDERDIRLEIIAEERIESGAAGTSRQSAGRLAATT